MDHKVYEDETIVCKDCGEEFVFSARDQEFFFDKMKFTNKPVRCKACREKKNSNRDKRAEFKSENNCN